ncbi:MAG: helix-turn-helix domain-containing protein [Clostridiales bacterium]|nr:helix-turn-helix domain-containing protein [Clostridiales bacterium]
MPVFRVEKNTNYTTMCNYHLRDRNLTLKAKGLLSVFLSLPDNWDYSIAGLAAICKEGRSGISSGLKELEQCGYLVRERRRDAKGLLRDNVYVIYEMPRQGVSPPKAENPAQDNPAQENPTLDNPMQESPALEEPALENQAQINKEERSKEEINTDSNKRRKEKEPRHQYGEYGNVLLSDSELSSLRAEFPQDYQRRIERLSEYMASTGKSYKSHLATIRSWARRDRRQAASIQGAAGTYSHDNYRCEEGESL